jgi:phosphoribosylglycinamide formyltransferase-1
VPRVDVERVAVLVSGSGTNLQALLDDPSIAPAIALVLADRPGIRALERAAAAEVEGLVVEPGSFPDREAFDAAMLAALRGREIDVLVAAGYLRLLGPAVLAAFEGRILNVHPSLLPAFPGTRSIGDALTAGVKVTGVTVFLVDGGVDTGPVVLQEAVEVLPDDDERSLAERIHAVEHRLLPRAVRALLEGRIKVEGRRVHLLER